MNETRRKGVATQCEILSILANTDGPITVNQIRELMSQPLSRQWVELLCRKLVEAEKVKRYGAHGDSQGYSYEVLNEKN